MAGILNWKIWGHKSRKEKTKSKCQIIAIPICEGLNSYKRPHVHLILGNIPEDKQPILRTMIREIWKATKVGMERMKLDKVYDADGMSFYLAKEVGFVNNDAVDWNIASIPSVLYPHVGTKYV